MSKFNVSTYNPKDISLILKGKNIENWADGDDVIKVKYPEALYESKAGVKGEIATNEIIDPRIIIEIAVWFNSPDKQYLNDLASSRESFPVAFIDNNNYSDSISGEHGRIKKKADIQSGKDIDKAVYEIEILDGGKE